jgi:hypothetical protein
MRLTGRLLTAKIRKQHKMSRFSIAMSVAILRIPLKSVACDPAPAADGWAGNPKPARLLKRP